MSVSEIALIVFLVAIAFFLFGWLVPIAATVAGISAVVCVIAKLARS